METKAKKISYQMRSVLLARMLAELTVFALLSLSPLILFALGIFQQLHVIYRAMICIVSPVSLGLAWALCQIPFRAELDETTISFKAFFRKQTCLWTDLQSITLKNSIGWRHYRLISKNEEISFPCQINNVQDLVEKIRAHLPARGRVKTGENQNYKLAPIAHLLLVAQATLWLGFVFIFGSFFRSLHVTANISQTDIILVLALEIIVALAVLWQFISVLLLPTEIELEKDLIRFKTLKSSKTFPLQEVESLTENKFPFPEGVKLKSKKQSRLISSSIDSFDELLEELKQRLNASIQSK